MSNGGAVGDTLGAENEESHEGKASEEWEVQPFSENDFFKTEIEGLKEAIRLLGIEIEALKNSSVVKNTTPTIEDIPPKIEVLPIKKSRFI